MGDENNPNNEANKPISGAADNGSAANGQENSTMNGNSGASSSVVGGGGGGAACSDSPTTATSSGAVSSVIAAAVNSTGNCGNAEGEIQVIADQNGHNNNGDNNSVPDSGAEVENGILNNEPSGNDAGGNGDSGVEEGNGVDNNNEMADNAGGGGDNNNIAGTVGGGGVYTTEADVDIGGGPPTDTGLLSEGGLSSIIGVGPPSPLTGCYLLIVLGEPHSDEHKDIILQRLIKGLLSWDMTDCHVDLEEELNTITQHAPEGEEARYGERLIQYASENLVTEILIHPQYNTLIQCMRNLLSSFTRHRHIIHSGYTFSSNGSWILQDGTFSVSDFSEAFQEHEVQRVIRAYPDTISTNIHCADAGLWLTLPDKSYAKLCKIRINPNDVLDISEKINEFIDYLAPMLVPATIHDLLETSDVVGNIRFSHPTLYVFPGGQGDAALFGINGFNMLVDGGFNRKACFWDFARHLDRLDAVLLTRINNSNISGLSSVVERKKDDHVYPQIGHFFCNIPERKSLLSPDGDKDKDPLLIELIERSHNLVNNLKVLNLKPQHCYRDTEPINLYHKVGHGTLDMYVISPSKDSKEVKEFLQKWHVGDNRLFASKDTKEFNFPLQNLVSICAMLVWQPANPEDTITRILFPGSTPDFKILEGLDRIKHLEFMKHPTCTAKTIAPASPPVIPMIKKSLKASQFEKTEPPLPSKVVKPIPSTDKQDNKIIDNKNKIIQQQDNKIQETESEIIPTKLESKLIEDELKEDSIKDEQIDDNKDNDIISTDNEIDNKAITEKKVEVVIVKPQMHEDIKKEEIEMKSKNKQKIEKPRAEVKPVVRARIDTKPPKSMERKTLKKDLISDKKASPTATPQKKERSLKDKEIKSKVISRISKSSPSSTPAKSAKDANNRKVLESKQKASKVVKREITKTVTEKKEIKTERKPISRRPRGSSPSRHVPGSPVKSIKPKSDLRKSRLEKGGTTTDSSLVSTPSADEFPAAKKIPQVENVQDIDPIKQRELDDLKEEQEVVREIEAVFNRDEQKRQKDLKPGHREVGKQDSTTEAEEEEEYLIIEKEEIEQYTEDSINDQESSMTKEEEIQKHQRDSQESEKKRKTSAEEEIEAAIAKAEAAETEENARAKKSKEIDIKQIDSAEKLLSERKENDDDDDDDIQPDSIEEKIDLTSPEKGEIKAEVQDILISAKEIVKAKTEEIKTEEMSSPTPEEKISSAKKTSDTKDELLEVPDVNKETNLQESLPEEKFSATIESGATTAPTLPEDERIPLDEIKEDFIIEEKYVKEETKEAEIPVSPPKTIEPIQQIERILPGKMQFQTQSNLLRDIVKTPDEVADLPVHEEADIGYDEVTSDGKRKSYAKEDGKPLKEEIAKEEKEVEEIENIQEEKIDVINKLENKEINLVTTTKSARQNEETKITETPEIHSEDKHVSVVDSATARLKEKDEASFAIQHGLLIKDSITSEKETADLNITEHSKEKTIISPYNYISQKSSHSPEQKLSEIKTKNTPLIEAQAIEDNSEDKKHMVDILVKGSSEASAPTSEDEVPDTLKVISKSIQPKDRNDTTSVESPGTIEEIIAVDISNSKFVKDDTLKKDHITEKHETEIEEVLKIDKSEDQERANIAIEQIVSTPVHIAEEKDFVIASEITEICEAQSIESDKKVTTEKLTTEIATTVKKNITNNFDLSKNIVELKQGLSTDVESFTTDIKPTIFKKMEQTARKIEDTEIILSNKIDHEAQKVGSYLEDGFIGLTETVNGQIDEIEKKVEKIKGNMIDKIEEDNAELIEILKYTEKTSECIDEKSEDSPKIVGVITKGTEKVKEVFQTDKNVEEAVEDIQEIIKSEAHDITENIQDSIKNEMLVKNIKLSEVTDFSIVDLPTKTETNITSVLGGIAQEIASVLAKEKTESDGTELKIKLTDDESTAKKSSFEITGFTTELRETHITTIDSPVIEEPGHVEDYNTITYEREDSGLNDIKEEEEENRYSPPRKASTDKLIKVEAQPPRPVSPREKEVAIIVANVAQVLKSDKPITEIIPDFDEKQLEEKLLKTAKEVESTVQRMLVTASSEDGGEEIEICPHGSIKFTPASTPEILSGKATPDATKEFESDIKDIKLTSECALSQISKTSYVDEESKIVTKSQPASEKSSPEHKSTSFSIEEKDKIEISEKQQIKEVQPIIEQVKPERKDSIITTAEQSHVDRRQSIVSISSEKDLTKDESTLDEKLDFGSSIELCAETKSIKESQTKEIIIENSNLDKKCDEKVTLPSIESSHPVSVTTHADDNESSRRESIASINEIKTAKDIKKEMRKETIISETFPSDKKLDGKAPTISREHSRPELVASQAAEKDSSRRDSFESTQEINSTAERKESIVSETLSYDNKLDDKTASQSKEHSHPEAAGSHAAGQDPSRRQSLKSAPEIKDIEEKKESINGETFSFDMKSDEKFPSPSKEHSRPQSIASHVDEKESTSREFAASTHESKEAKEDSEKIESVIIETLSLDKKSAEQTHSQSKENSRPDSGASHIDEQKCARSESVTSSHETKETNEDSDKKESIIGDILYLDQKSSEQTTSPSKEHSRPESAASHVDDKEKARRESVISSHESKEAKEDLRRKESIISETLPLDKKSAEQTPSPSKEHSRPESVASHIDEKDSARRESVTSSHETKESEEDLQRNESIISETLSLGKKSVEQTPSPSKDHSRPESATSHDGDKERTRIESVSSSHESKEAKEDSEKKESIISEPLSLGKKSAEQPPSPSKEHSRPETAASHVDVKEKARRESVTSSHETKESEEDLQRNESIISKTLSLGKKSAEQTPSPSKEHSRPESAASHVDDKERARRESVASSHDSKEAKEDLQRKESIISEKLSLDKKSAEQTPSQSKENSRPESAASHVDDKERARRESVISSHESTEAKEDLQRKESIISEKLSLDKKSAEQTPSPSKEHSRPESAASHIDEQNCARRESVASSHESKEAKEDLQRKESIISETLSLDKKSSEQTPSPSKEHYRPESVASHIDEKESARRESVASSHESKEAIEDSEKKESVIIETISLDKKSDEQTPSPSKQHSRPESAASHIDEKEGARRESVASSHESTEAKEDSEKKESVIIETLSLVKKLAETTPSPSKENSRPESAASHVDDKERARRESVISSHEITEAKEDLQRKESIISEKLSLEKKSAEQTPSQSKEHSRPESAASHIDEQNCARRESVASSHESKEAKEDLQGKGSIITETLSLDKKSSEQTPSPSKEHSRSESAASHIDEKEGARRESVASSHESKEAKEDSEKKESVIIETLSLDQKLAETTPSPSKENSRPESAASHVDDKERARRESVISSHEITEAKEDLQRKESIIGEKLSLEKKSAEQTPSQSKEHSRPESAASHIDEKEGARRESVASSHESKEAIEDSEKKESVIIETISLDKKSDEQTPSPSKQHSRPESAASHIDEKEGARRESVASSHESKEAKEDSEKKESVIIETLSLDKKSAEQTPSPSKENSRPESAASNIDEKESARRESVAPSPSKEHSRPESAASHIDEKESARRESEASIHENKEAKEDSEKKESVIIETLSLDKKSAEQTHSPSKQHSRPESAASHVDDKERARRESVTSSHESKEAKEDLHRKESITSEAVSLDKKSAEQTPSQSKENSRPESAASHIDEKESARRESVAPSPSKEHSRPESAASHIDEKESARRESEASIHENKEAKEDSEKKESVIIETLSLDKKSAELTPSPSKQHSRPESAASHVDDKERARRESLTSSHESKEAKQDLQRKDSITSEALSLDKKSAEQTPSQSKANSRPESAASHVDDKEKTRRESVVSSHESKEAKEDSEKKESVIIETLSLGKNSTEETSSPSKEHSRPESAASYVDDKEKTRRESVVSSHESKEAKEDSEKKESVIIETLSLKKKSAEQTPSQSKENSRPESGASHVDEKESARRESITEKKESVIIETLSLDKNSTEETSSPSKEHSSPESAASHVDDKEKTRRESVVSSHESKEAKEDSEKKESVIIETLSLEKKSAEQTPSPSKEHSRPESAARHFDDKERARRESVTSTHETKEAQEDLQRKESIISETLSLDKKSAEQTPSQSKENSRPESGASHVDEKESVRRESIASSHESKEAKEDSEKKESVIIETLSLDKKSAEKPTSPSKEHSRPESAASHVDDKEKTRRESVVSSHESKEAKEDSEKKESVIIETLSLEKKSAEQTPSPSKEHSRPESAASHVDDKERARRESVTSTHESKEAQEDLQRKESIISETLSLDKKSAEQTPSQSKEHSRPESAASHLDEKESARRESVASSHESKETKEDSAKKESVIIETLSLEKKSAEQTPSPSKEHSRPESAASHVDDKERARRESVTSSHESKEAKEDLQRKESIISETLSLDKKSDEQTPSPSKEHSRPESAASHVDDKERARRESVTSSHESKEAKEDLHRKESIISLDKKSAEQTPSPSKEHSRPESAASHLDEKESARRESVASSHESKETKEDSAKKESVIIETLSLEKKSAEQTPSPSKEHSRPESAASHVDDKERARRESVTSSHESKEAKEDLQRKESIISETLSLDKKSDEQTPSPSKEHSRPESAASHVDDKEKTMRESVVSSHESKEAKEDLEKKESIISETLSLDKKSDEQTPSPSKEHSRPESAASHVDDKEKTMRESVVSSHESKEAKEDLEKKESIISETLSLDKKSDEQTPSPSKEHSRPESAASHVDDKERARRESVTSSHESKESKEDLHRKESIISLDKKSAEQTPSPSKEHSRPESAASHLDEKESARRECVVSSHESKEAKEDSEKKESVIINTLSLEKKSAEQTPSPSKEHSRPESAASHVDDKERARRESVTSSHESKEAKEDLQRKESIISETLSLDKKSDEQTPSPSKEHSRPESAASHVDDKEKTMRESVVSSHESKEAKEDLEKKESVIIEILSLEKKSAEQTPSPSREHSRPESAASHVDDKERARRESVTSSHESKESKEDLHRKESIISLDKKSAEQTPSPSKEHSHPESAASHLDEKESGRRESVASSHESKEAKEDSEKKESVIINTLSLEKKSAEQTPSPSKENSRPESAASHVDDKERARRESVTSSHESKEAKQDLQREQSMISETLSLDKKSAEQTPSPSKEHSRPESAASHVDDKERTRSESVASSHESKEAKEDSEKKESVIIEALSFDKKSAEQTPSPSKEHSRPESAASHVDDKERARRESVTSSHESREAKEDLQREQSIISETLSLDKKSAEQTASPSKEHSRPESAASHVDDKERARRESVTSSHESKEAKEDLQREQSIISETLSLDKKSAEQTPSPSSAASHVEDKEKTRSESVACSHESKEAKEDSEKKESVSIEALSLDKKSAEQTPSPSKEHSRPESAASHVDDKERTRIEYVASSHETKEAKEYSEKKESIISEALTLDNKSAQQTPSPSKEHSRPDSAASHVDDTERTRSESVACSHESKEAKEHSEKKESVIIEALYLDKKSAEQTPSPAKEHSGPESAVIHVDDKERTRIEYVASSHETKEAKEYSEKKESIISEALSLDKKSAEQTPSPAKEHSRPESAVSHVDEKESARRESVASSRGEIDTKEVREKKDSIISATLLLDKKSEEQIPSPSKERSSPESVSSHVDEKESERRESVASSHEIKETKTDSQQKKSIISETVSIDKKSAQTTLSPCKEHSSPESVASHVDEKESARREFLASSHEIKETKTDSQQKKSIISETLSFDKKSAQTTPSPSKDHSRDESLASNVDVKDMARKESVASSHDSKESKECIQSKESISSEILSVAKISDEKTPSPSNKHSRPESAASHVDDKKFERKESVARSYDEKETKADIERKESIISETLSLDKKSAEKTPSPSKEYICPESTWLDEKDIERRESVASSHEGKDTQEDVWRKEAIISETLSQDKKSSDKTISPSKEHSRPESAVSNIDEIEIARKESVASIHNSTEANVDLERAESIIKDTLSVIKQSDDNTPSPTKEHSITTQSHSQEKVTSKMEYNVHKSELSKSEAESVVSHTSETKSPQTDSFTSSVLNQDDYSLSRLCSTENKSASKDSSKITETCSITSVSSNISNIHVTESFNNGYMCSDIKSKFDEENQSSSALIESKESLSRESASSTITKTESSYDRSQSDESSFVIKEKSNDSVRRESTKSQINEKVFSSQPSSDCEDNIEDDLLAMRDSRSKSIASIMITSIYKPSDELQHFSSLKEELSEHSPQLTEEIFSTKPEYTGMSSDGISLISISPESDVCRKFSDDDIKETTELKSEIETIVTSYIESSRDLKDDRKTPPTAPVSPNIKAEFTIGSKQTSSQISSKSISRDIISASGTSSGKSSPGVTISESRSIPTPADHSSMTGTPDSSPKPTSPFPRVSNDDIKGISTFSTPDVTRTSSPDVTEIGNLEKSALTASSEKIVTTTVTTITKIISSDGKETVTEEKTVTTRDTTDPDEERVTVTRTRTTSENEKKDDVKLPSTKEIAALKTEFRCSTPGSDDFDPHEVQSPRSDISSGQASRVTEDDEIPPSPLSITSHAAHSPPSKFSYEYDLQHSSSGISKKSDLDIDNSQDDIIPPQYGSEELKSALPITLSHKIDPMSTSFYGALPDTFGGKSDPIPIQKSTTSITAYQESLDSSQSGGNSFDQSWTSKKGDHKFLDEADLDFEKALEEHKQVRGEEVMSSVTAKYSYSPSKATIVDIECSKKQQFPLEDPVVKVKEITSKKPLPVEEVEKTNECTSTSKDLIKESKSETKDPTKVWGKPLGLPSPATISNENDQKTTPKKERKLMASKTKFNNEKNLRKRSESPVKAVKKNSPIYMDLTYVPHNGNSYYSHVEFFKKVRARYYVFSGTEPSREVYNALLEAKQTWEDKDLEVTIIPTYDTDVLGYWVSENEELLSKYHIDLSPSASRCTINLQDHETSCSAYRLEF